MIDSYAPRQPWWQKMDGASDGWVVECPETKWFIHYYFSPYEDMRPGAKYKLSVRVKGAPKQKDGTAFVFGVDSSDKAQAKFNKVSTADLGDDRFRVFELEGVEMPPGGWCMFGFYLPPDKPMPKVFLDCLWLTEKR